MPFRRSIYGMRGAQKQTDVICYAFGMELGWDGM